MTLADNEELHIQIDQLRLANQQAAEYGLELLNEKQILQVQYEELENRYELLKIEYHKLKSFQINQNEKIFNGEITEEKLLNEKQVCEEYLTKEIKRYEDELCLLKQDNERLYNENEKNLLNSQKLTEEIYQLNTQLKYDLKESKKQEQKLIDINTELEEDNLALQQQLQKLREHLIDYDGLKLENKQLQENIDDLHRTMTELESLRAIAESQLKELHDNLRNEREQKHIYKQQLDNRIQQDSLRNLDSLRLTLSDTYTTDDDDDSDASCILSSIDYSDQPTGNLFSEIHDNEIRKIKSSLDNQLIIINEKIKILYHKIQHINQRIFPNQNSFHEINFDDTNQLLIISLDSIEQIDKDQELSKSKLNEQEQIIFKLKQDLNIMMKQWNDTQIIFNKTHVHLIKFSNELETIHSYMFTSSDLPIPLSDIQMKTNQLTNSNNKIIDPIINENILDILQQQIKQLKQSYDIIKQTEITSKIDVPNDIKELQDQIIKQQSLLTAKREEINTLRTIIKAQEQTAEIALSNLKTKYENEKSITIETITKLRCELKTLKEDSTSFSTLRTIFTARCDEYAKQIIELKNQIHLAMEEKKTLNSLLRMAIEQKLSLIQKLETNNATNSSSPFTSLDNNQNIVNAYLIPEAQRGRYIPPRMLQAFETSRNQQIRNKR